MNSLAGSVLIWTCVGVFVSTAIITILALLGIVKLERIFLNRLFFALILEVIPVCVLFFKKSFTTSECAIVRITFPKNDVSNFTAPNLFISGVCFLGNENQKLLCKISSDEGTEIKEITTFDSKGFFNFPYKVDLIKKPGRINILCRIVEGKDTINHDESSITFN